MPTALPALATVADLAGRLQLVAPTVDPALTAWNNALLDGSNAVRDAVGQPLTPGTSTLPVKINQSGSGIIPICPVVSITQIVDWAGNVLPNDGTGWETDPESPQRLNILQGYYSINPLSRNDPVYKVTLSHGWSVLPGELFRWVLIVAAAQLQNSAVGSLGVNGGANSVAIDDGKVTYADVSGMIPDNVKARLRAMYGGEA